MTPEQLYDLWAPQASAWSAWAKPVLFASLPAVSGLPGELPPLPDVAWAPAADAGTALVVDLRGPLAVLTGLALARRGFCPVPLFNGCSAPGMVVDVAPIQDLLARGGALLCETPPAAGAPPVFLLDADRLSAAGGLYPGRYDNRWAVVPQDFPSASCLLRAGITAVCLAAPAVRDDLAHVLRRYQEAGLRLSSIAPTGMLAAPDTPVPSPQPLEVPRPRFLFRSAWYRLLVFARLRRNAAGGFGAVVPQPSSHHGHG
jgi:hypothetical protein